MRVLVLRLAASFAVAWPGLANAQVSDALVVPAPGTLEAEAVGIVRSMADGKFADITPLFDATMKSAMPAATIEQTWKAIQQQVGPFRSIDGVRRADAGGYRAVLVTTAFEKGVLDFRVVFDAEGLVAGFFAAPGGKPLDPSYADRGKFSEEAIEVVTGEYRLPGTLAIPKAEAKPPIVVLVHGSGPNDRDETIGPNKVFRDLAWGLAAIGVASLRYDKRTLVYGARLNVDTLTYREETVEDALSAIEIAALDPRFDASRVALIGHSLGGLLAPAIASETNRLAGAVLMAGSNRPLDEIMLEQVEYIFLQDGDLSEAEKKQIEDLKRDLDAVKSGEGKSAALGGAGKTYFDALDAYDPILTAQKLELPLLVVQGGRDYQVRADKDFTNWHAGLVDRINVTFKLYPDLDHLFMAGSGPSYPSDYMKPRNVSEEFIADLAEWISNL